MIYSAYKTQNQWWNELSKSVRLTGYEINTHTKQQPSLHKKEDVLQVYTVYKCTQFTVSTEKIKLFRSIQTLY